MSTLAGKLSTLHGPLLEALDGADCESALEQAFLQLNRCGDFQLLLALAKALIRTGVAGIAARLVRSMCGLVIAEPQVASLAGQLERLPSGEISADTLQRRL